MTPDLWPFLTLAFATAFLWAFVSKEGWRTRCERERRYSGRLAEQNAELRERRAESPPCPRCHWAEVFVRGSGPKV